MRRARRRHHRSSPAAPLGVAALAGPTGGYLRRAPWAAVLRRRRRGSGGAGLVAAVVIAVLAGPGGGSRARAALAMLAGNVAIYLCGVPWLARFVDGGLVAAVALGMTPFLIGDAIKLIAALALVPPAGSAERGSER